MWSMKSTADQKSGLCAGCENDKNVSGLVMYDIKKNRRSKKYSLTENLLRVLWWPSSIAFRLIPRPFYNIRNTLLRTFGARIGKEVRIDNTVRIMFPWELSVGDYSSIGYGAIIYNLGKVSVGSRVTISQRVHLCAGTHDYRKPDFPLIRGKIIISDCVWVAADAFIGPQIDIGENAIVGACSVVTKDVSPNHIVMGNPARLTKIRDSLGGPEL